MGSYQAALCEQLETLELELEFALEPGLPPSPWHEEQVLYVRSAWIGRKHTRNCLWTAHTLLQLVTALHARQHFAGAVAPCLATCGSLVRKYIPLSISQHDLARVAMHESWQSRVPELQFRSSKSSNYLSNAPWGVCGNVVQCALPRRHAWRIENDIII